MDKNSRIYVAGHRGLAGSAILRALKARGYANLVTRTHADLDLTQAPALERLFAAERPQYLFLAAAKVGGIVANDTYPGEFIFSNLAIQGNVLDAARRYGVRRLLFLGSSCIYPRECPQPMREEYLLTGALEPSNSAYAVAKIAGVEMCRAYNRQYGTRFLAAMPTNLYGSADNYDLMNSHALPALIRKAHEAKVAGADRMTVWGTGAPRREFLYSDDMAEGCLRLMELKDAQFDALLNDARCPALINVGCGQDTTIRTLAETICEIVGFGGRLEFDASKPDGTPQKLLDCSRIHTLGWRAGTSLADGIRLTYEDYLRTGAATDAPALRIATATA
ncbi:MAG: GDP-L-fucose synthase [Candidatus Parcubacteria bacterium]|nr:GDP-L-fucose synthase [Burkholderiales bacterium]